ncbi:17449_t:CDS:1 [Entrophospora sp. SA101]|nr:17449_t:CDS:1 [Entrophospora sp. SA101]
MPNICCSCKEPSSPLYTDCIVTHSFMVVGMRFRGGHKFKKSDTITLEPEPSNTYDKNAIKIMVDGTHKAYVAKDENVSIGDLMKKYPNYRITAHGKKNYNKSASLNLEYPWMVCERCRDTLQASRDYDYSYW